jgi:hypothetical protein
MMVARRTPGAGVRKPPREETAGDVARPRVYDKSRAIVSSYLVRSATGGLLLASQKFGH